jgi:putative transposase
MTNWLGIGWGGPRVDGSIVKAPFAQAAVGPAPTDCGKQGTKRSILCDRRGILLALVIEGANRHDMKLLACTLEGSVRAQIPSWHRGLIPGMLRSAYQE